MRSSLMPSAINRARHPESSSSTMCSLKRAATIATRAFGGTWFDSDFGACVLIDRQECKTVSTERNVTRRAPALRSGAPTTHAIADLTTSALDPSAHADGPRLHRHL